MTESCESLNKKKFWFLLSGIFLVSFAMLAFEVTVTRILSVILSYHYVFATVSLALLGLGFGAIFNHLFWKKIPGQGVFGSLPLLAGWLAFSIPFSILLMARITHLEAFRDGTLLYLLTAAIPFLFAGIIFAELFRAFPSLSSKLYGMDLLGAAFGSVGAIIALNIFGGMKTMAVISVIALIAALIYTVGAIGRNIKQVLLVMTSLLMIFSLVGTTLISSRLADIPVGTTDKEMNNFLADSSSPAQIVETRWSAFGRTDLVSIPGDPTEMVIFVDGTAGTPMYQFNGDIEHPDPEIQALQTEFPGYLALANFPRQERDSALIIGPGGGRDILLAQMAGVSKITAVEVNPDIVDLARKYRQYNGDIYDAKNVSVIVDEGRNFLKRQNEKYDIIMLSLPITKTSQGLKGYALTESFLFTVDSIGDYLEHLSDNGRLIVVAHNPVEIIKLLSISLNFLNQRGIENESAMKQVSVIGSHHFPVFMLKKTPFASAEMVSMHQSIHELGYDPTLSYLPMIKLGNNISHLEKARFDECSMFNSLLATASQGKVNLDDLNSYFQKNGLDISPVNDNRPFFYKFEAGIPQPVTLVFGLSLVILVSATVAFYIRRKNRSAQSNNAVTTTSVTRNLLRFIILFSMLGIGFMLVEISIFQRFILFIGQPVLSLAIMLASLLSGAGIGSIYSGRFAEEKISRVLVIITPVIAVTLFLYVVVLPIIFNQLLGLELAWRLLTAALVLLPLGFLMGFPFPLGMRLLKEVNLEDSIPWMWGINGIGSVVGSAMAIMVAISFGFTASLVLGAVCYLIIFLTFYGKGKFAPAREVRVRA